MNAIVGLSRIMCGATRPGEDGESGPLCVWEEGWEEGAGTRGAREGGGFAGVVGDKGLSWDIRESRRNDEAENEFDGLVVN